MIRQWVWPLPLLTWLPVHEGAMLPVNVSVEHIRDGIKRPLFPDIKDGCSRQVWLFTNDVCYPRSYTFPTVQFIPSPGQKFQSWLCQRCLWSRDFMRLYAQSNCCAKTTEISMVKIPKDFAFWCKCCYRLILQDSNLIQVHMCPDTKSLGRNSRKHIYRSKTFCRHWKVLL